MNYYATDSIYKDIHANAMIIDISHTIWTNIFRLFQYGC